METEEKTILIVVRILPSGEELDVELPISCTGLEIIEELLLQNVAPRGSKAGDPYIYKLIRMFDNSLFGEGSLAELNVKHGETFFLVPDLVAGGDISNVRNIQQGGSSQEEGKVIYEVPDKLEVGKKERCVVRIGRETLEDFLLEDGLNGEKARIEINNLMIVQLKENSIKNHLVIKALNHEEQIISADSYTEWNFDITPITIGFTSILLRITMSVMIEGFGERKKDVFTFNKEIEITKDRTYGYGASFDSFQESFTWSDNFRKDLYNLIALNKTGLALAKLSNLFQKRNKDLFNMVLLFQSQWNMGKNQCMLELISINEWMRIQTKVNYGLLELIQNVEDEVLNPGRDVQIVHDLSNQVKEMLT